MTQATEKKCISICKLDQNGVCIGCKRTVEEIIKAGLDANKENQS